MAKDEAQMDITDLARRTQALFNPTGMALPQVDQVLTLQQEMAGQTETFARHWFERRQEAAETGLEALREMSAANGADPMAAMRAITDWQRGSFERLNADLRDWVALCTQLTQLSGTPQSGPASSTTDRSADKPEPTKARSRAASGARSQHATPV
jgi:hypothetical protein